MMGGLPLLLDEGEEEEKEEEEEALPLADEELVAKQLAAMSRMVAIQEEAMGRAKEATAGGQERKLAAAYVAVLAAWRGTVFELLVQRASAAMVPVARERGDDRLSALELEAEREKGRATEALARREARRASKAEAEVEDMRLASQERDAALAREAAFRDEVRAAAQEAHRGLCASFVGREATLLVAAARQDEQATRLERCAARLRTLGHLLSQRDVKLRNAAAALSADRKLWARERRDAERAALAEAGDALPAEEAILSQGLRPEAEAVMRSVFCDLDADGRGAVDRVALSRGLRDDPRLGRLMTHWVGAQAWDRALAAIDRDLGRPHDLDDDDAHGGVRKPDVTWGEFLLLFVSRDDRRERPPPPPATLEAGLRLTLPPPTTEEGGEEESSWDRLGVAALREEVVRLSRDRSALVRSLASARRASARARDEAALLWRHETRGLKLRVDQLDRDLRAERRERTDAQETLAAERADRDARADRARDAAARSEAAAKASLAKKEAEIEALARDARLAADAATTEAGRLEAALAACRRDRDAAVAESRALERETKRLQDQLREQERDARAARDADLKARDAQVAAVKRERDALLRILREHRLNDGALPSSSSSGQRGVFVADDDDSPCAATTTSPPSRRPPLAPRAVISNNKNRPDDDDDHDDHDQVPSRSSSLPSDARGAALSPTSTKKKTGKKPLERACLDNLRAITHDLLGDDDEDDDEFDEEEDTIYR